MRSCTPCWVRWSASPSSRSAEAAYQDHAQRWEAVAARYDEEKLRIAGAVRSAPALPGQARQYAGDRGRPYDDGAPAPGTVARPHVERPDDRRY
jgi:hypothetical protein